MTFSLSGSTITQSNESSQSITAVADGGSNTLTISVTGHGYSAGDLVQISGTTSYNGVYLINSVNTNDFNIPDTDLKGNQNLFGSSETGNVARGDKDLSGLVGIAGVTDQTEGDYTLYTLDGLQIDLDGALFIDPELEGLFYTDTQPSDYAFRVSATGDLVVGINNSDLAFSEGTWLKTTRKAVTAFSNSGEYSFRLQGGSVVFNGGTLDVAASPNINTGTFKSNKLTCYLRETNNQKARFVINQNGTYDNLNMFFNGVNVTSSVSSISFNNLFISNASSIGVHPGFDGLELVNYDYVLSGPLFIFAGDKTWFNRNSGFGTSGGSSSYNSGNAGTHDNMAIEITKSVNFSFSDTTGSSVEDVKIYSIERDNSGTNHADWPHQADNRNVTVNGVDYSTPSVYTATSDVSGNASITNFLFGLFYQIQDGGRLRVLCRFTKSNDATDVHDFLFCSYNHLLSSTDISLQGTGEAQVDRILVDDGLISETNKATVDAYSTIDDAFELYDIAKSNLYDNFAGETDLLLTRSGPAAELGADNIVLDATAASAFDFTPGSPNTFTLHTDTFTGDITTTGTITVQNGTVLSGSTIIGEVTTPDSGTTHTGITVSKIIHTGGGTMVLDNSTVTEIENTSGSLLTVTLSNGSPVPTLTETSGSIVVVNDMSVTITGLTVGDTVRVEDNLGVQQEFEAMTSGTTFQFTITRDNDGEVWGYVIDRAGFTAATGNITVAEGTSLTIPINKQQYLKAGGGVMYTGTSTPLITVSFDTATPQATIDIGDGPVTPQQIFDEFEAALLTPTGMRWHLVQGSVVTHDELPGVGTILFMQDNIRIRRASAGDNNAAVAGYVLSTDNIVIDGTNGSVAFVAGFSNASIASAVWDSLESNHTTTGTMGDNLSEIHTRLDLNESSPNTYQDDNSEITNSDFTLTSTDNGNGTFTVTKT